MMRDDNTLDKFPQVILAMREVVEKGGYGTSVTPVSQFYWQQAYANVMFGPWKQIAPGYGKMVLGYFGKTPVAPDEEVIKLASAKLKLKPTTRNPLDIADEDPTKSIDAWKERLDIESIEKSEENIFISAACGEKGIAFLKGESSLNIRKIDITNNEKGNNTMADGNYTVVVDGKKFSVQVAQGDANIQVAPVVAPLEKAPVQELTSSEGGTQVEANVNGNVWKILVDVGDKVEQGDVVAILEAMKMEIDIEAPSAGTITSVAVKTNDAVEEGQTVLTIG
jgi:pyruvate carboxylase subunit B